MSNNPSLINKNQNNKGFNKVLNIKPKPTFQ